MSRKNERLIEKSIKHWTRMRDDPWGIEEPTPKECPLCMAYARTRQKYDYHTEYCYGCPIVAVAGKDSCDATPYSKAAGAFWAWLDIRPLGKDTEIAVARRKWRRAAKSEILFLQKVLKAEQAKRRTR